jgi:hypothetical protein
LPEEFKKEGNMVIDLFIHKEGAIYNMYIVSLTQIIIYENIGSRTDYYAINRGEEGILTEGCVDCNA